MCIRDSGYEATAIHWYNGVYYNRYTNLRMLGFDSFFTLDTLSLIHISAPGETPLFFARRLDRQKALPVQVLPLWRIMAMSHYSRVEPGPAETARAKDVFSRL